MPFFNPQNLPSTSNIHLITQLPLSLSSPASPSVPPNKVPLCSSKTSLCLYASFPSSQTSINFCIHLITQLLPLTSPAMPSVPCRNFSFVYSFQTSHHSNGLVTPNFHRDLTFPSYRVLINDHPGG